MTEHPFNHRRKKQAFWKTTEKRIAKQLDGERMPGSGSSLSPSRKGDVQDRYRLFVESKTTGKQSFTLRRVSLSKMVRQARALDRLPVMVITFEVDSPGVEEITEWAMIPLQEFEAFYGNQKGPRVSRKSDG